MTKFGTATILEYLELDTYREPQIRNLQLSIAIEIAVLCPLLPVVLNGQYYAKEVEVLLRFAAMVK